MNISWAVEQTHVRAPFSGAIGSGKAPDLWAFVSPFSSDRMDYINTHCRATDGQRRAQKKAAPFLRSVPVNTTDFYAFLCHAAVAPWIFLLIASLHIPPTTFPLSPPISCPCALCFMLSTTHTDVSLIQAAVRAGKWLWGVPFANMQNCSVEYSAASATVKVD